MAARADNAFVSVISSSETSFSHHKNSGAEKETT